MIGLTNQIKELSRSKKSIIRVIKRRVEKNPYLDYNAKDLKDLNTFSLKELKEILIDINNS